MRNLIITYFMVFSFSAFSDCEEAYRISNITKKKTGNLLSSVGAAAPPTGTFLYSVAIEAGGSSLLAGTSLGLTIAGPALTAAGATSYMSANSYKWVKKVISQSKIGMGEDLEEWAEELSEDLGKEITPRDISDIVLRGNDVSLFCSNNKLFKRSEFKEYVIKELKN